MELANTPPPPPRPPAQLPPLPTSRSAVPPPTNASDGTPTSVRHKIEIPTLFVRRFLWHGNHCCTLVLYPRGGPGVAGAAHPKRSPSGVGDGVGLKEERLSIRKPSTSTIGSRSIPTPSSPMVSSAHNPNKAEIPDRRKDVASAAVRL